MIAASTVLVSIVKIDHLNGQKCTFILLCIHIHHIDIAVKESILPTLLYQSKNLKRLHITGTRTALSHAEFWNLYAHVPDMTNLMEMVFESRNSSTTQSILVLLDRISHGKRNPDTPFTCIIFSPLDYGEAKQPVTCFAMKS